MREYVRGAFQALAWVRMQLSNVKDMQHLEKALAEVDKALDKIKITAAADFTADMQAELGTHSEPT